MKNKKRSGWPERAPKHLKKGENRGWAGRDPVKRRPCCSHMKRNNSKGRNKGDKPINDCRRTSKN